MSKFKVDVNGDVSHTEAQPAPAAEHAQASDNDNLTEKAVAVGVVVVGAALFEAALIPGILLGAAAMFAPKVFPKIGERMEPLVNGTVRGVYKIGRKARAVVGEAQERMSDIAAEVHAEESETGEGSHAAHDREGLAPASS
jgi:hypothetical protein